MGNKESTTTKINGHPKSAAATSNGDHVRRKKPLLNARQQDLLRKSWQRSQKTGLDSVGARIFRKIFASDPSVRKIFDLDGVEVENLKYNAQFRSHAATFTKTLTFLVSNLSDMDKIGKYAQALGARHVKFEERGFKMSLWDTFAEALTECTMDWEGGVRCREAMTAWRVLVAYLIDQMRLGFERERRKESEQALLSPTDDTPAAPNYRD